MISIFVPGKPVTKGSKRGFVVGKHVVIKEQNNNVYAWQEFAASKASLEMAKNGINEPFRGPIRLNIIAKIRKPKKPKNPFYPITAPDIDKVERAVFDALTGVVYLDDAQVVDGTRSKAYEDYYGPGVLIEFEEIK